MGFFPTPVQLTILDNALEHILQEANMANLNCMTLEFRSRTICNNKVPPSGCSAPALQPMSLGLFICAYKQFHFYGI